jgi:alkylated DNA repair dioxygenase AlkB
MFKGDLKSEVKKSALPSELEGVFQYIKKEYDSRYNQLTVNWYDIGQGIVKHSDCTSKMVEDSKILILSFLEHSSDKHFFTLYDKLDNKIEVVNFSRNNVIEMSGASQLTTRHKVDSSSTNKGGRVSLTFRMMRED